MSGTLVIGAGKAGTALAIKLRAIGHAGPLTTIGPAEPYLPTPLFGSDQFGLKRQIAGPNAGCDRVGVRAGARPGTVSRWDCSGPALMAVDAMNDPRADGIGRRLVGAEVSPDAEHIAEPDRDLRTLVAA